ncbi:MAG: T9SS type A sorting domain-containing protein [Saprospiraceae bacterium]
MTQNYQANSRWGAMFFSLLLLFCLPLLSRADNYEGGGCCSDYDYWIKFPKDATANCAYPDAGDIEISEGHCDLLAISKEDKKFTVPGSSNCYKIFRTYKVLNWCEYVDGSDPVVVSRDEDCDGAPGDEDVYVIVKTRNGYDPCENDTYGNNYGYGYGYGYGYQPEYQHVWYDRDPYPYNDYPAAKTKGKSCEYESNPKGFWKEVTDKTNDGKHFRDHCEMASVGFWQYTQMIKVSDYDAPEIHFAYTEPFCSYSNNQAAGCPGAVSLTFSVKEDCSPQDVTVKAYFDKDRNGSSDYEVTHLLTGTYPNYQLDATFPIGAHFIKVVADDGCGNTGVAKIPFEVEDCDGPSPICINGLAIKLMPVIPAADVNGDGSTDDGAMEIWASDFIASEGYDCSGPVHYSINRVGEAVDKNKTGLVLTCDDQLITLVEVHAWDSKWNNDYCLTYVQVQRNDGLCPERTEEEEEDDGVIIVDEEDETPAGYGMLAGRIFTEYEMPIEGVMVHRVSEETEDNMSDVLGQFAFSNTTMGESYLIQPEANADWLRGITISDLHLLKKYLMGLAELDSPYKMLAADLDGSGSITQEDLDLLWKLFLFQATELETTTSWKFVPESYEFPDLANPWSEEVPKVILLEALEAAYIDLNFIAVKMGDLDESIVPIVGSRTTNGSFALQMPDRKLVPGVSQRIDLTARDLAQLQAYQATFAFDPDLVEVTAVYSGLASTDHFNLTDLKEGLLHTAWHRPVGEESFLDEDAPLFTLELLANEEVNLSEVLRISRRGLPAEAIGSDEEVMDLQLEFQAEVTTAAGFAVEQNTPNPFRQQTQIRYSLPEAGPVQIRVADVNGQLLDVIRMEGAAGNNTVTIDRRNWASGILFYTVTAGGSR